MTIPKHLGLIARLLKRFADEFVTEKVLAIKQSFNFRVAVQLNGTALNAFYDAYFFHGITDFISE